MKKKGVWFAFFIALLFLLIFQSLWLYSTYKIRKDDIENNINALFVKSCEKELEYRYDKYLSADQPKYVSLDVADDMESSVEQVLDKDVDVFQQILELMGKSIEVSVLDSLFKEKLADIGVSNGYLIYYKDSAGNILEQVGNLSIDKLDKAFYTDILLIVEGKRLQAVVDLSPAVVFQQMIWLLVASFLMLLIIVVCVVYQAQTIVTQYKLNLLREDFSNALTHDMKTPLSTINAVLSQFREGALDNLPDMREKFGRIGMEQVAGLQVLVEKILTIAKLEEGKLLIERSDADVKSMVKELKERFIVSKDKQVIIHLTFDLGNYAISLDSTLIKNAIANLIENAVKYSGESVIINLDCYVMNNQLFIRVQDNGLGISTKDHQKIFEKFERGAAVGRKGAKGFGLGLNYVKRVVEAHGGIVTLFSAEGKGSEFTLVLPLNVGDSAI